MERVVIVGDCMRIEACSWMPADWLKAPFALIPPPANAATETASNVAAVDRDVMVCFMKLLLDQSRACVRNFLPASSSKPSADGNRGNGMACEK